jgi:hypothetical protein
VKRNLLTAKERFAAAEKLKLRPQKTGGHAPEINRTRFQ